MEAIGLVVCTTGTRAEQLRRCVDSHVAAARQAGIELVERIFVDRKPAKALHHLVGVRNRAVDLVNERWAFFCDDDDFVFPNHAQVLLGGRTNYPQATVVMAQAQDAAGKRLGFTLACSLVNVDRFRMVNWLCPPTGGEDYFTLTTLETRHHVVLRESTVTWQVCDDVPSLTRDERVELHRP